MRTHLLLVSLLAHLVAFPADGAERGAGWPAAEREASVDEHAAEVPVGVVHPEAAFAVRNLLGGGTSGAARDNSGPPPVPPPEA